MQGDLASRDEYGLWYLHGRSDDTIKVAGKRTGPAEIESVLIGTGLVTDAAVVGVADAIMGSALVCVCVLSAQAKTLQGVSERLAEVVSERLGKSYRPRRVIFATDLPRTRNQKIMRRVVRSILEGTPPGDLSSLSNPESLDEIARVANA